jgi:hypothetical protein
MYAHLRIVVVGTARAGQPDKHVGRPVVSESAVIPVRCGKWPGLVAQTANLGCALHCKQSF